MDKIREGDADLWILTETHEVIDLSETHHGAATAPSPRKPRPGEARATIWSRSPIRSRIETSDSSEAVCVEVKHPDGPLLVYGSIIAWAGYEGLDGGSARWEEHYRYIEWHGQDWRRLRQDYPDLHLITGGDYSQNRDWARWYGTREGRGRLISALSDTGLACATQEDFVKAGKLKDRHTVDHLCLDGRLASRVMGVGAWEGERSDGLRMSDHCGLWVEVEAVADSAV